MTRGRAAAADEALTTSSLCITSADQTSTTDTAFTGDRLGSGPDRASYETPPKSRSSAMLIQLLFTILRYR